MTRLVDEAHVLGPLADIPVGEGRAYAVGDLQIAVFRLRNGTVRATQAVCPHAGGPLADGQPLDEPYIFENTPLESRAFGPVTVPEGRLWVMGDHRSASADSKAHMSDKYSGTIGVDDVIGKAAVIVWPVSRFGLLDSPDIQGTEAAALGVMPAAVGLVGAVPVIAWRRRRSESD